MTLSATFSWPDSITDAAQIRAAFEADCTVTPGLSVDVAVPDPAAPAGPAATLQMCQALQPHLKDGMAMYAEPYLAIAVNQAALKTMTKTEVALVLEGAIGWLLAMGKQLDHSAETGPVKGWAGPC